MNLLIFAHIMRIETTEKKQFTPKPKWLRVKLPTGKKYTDLRGLVDKYNLNYHLHIWQLSKYGRMLD